MHLSILVESTGALPKNNEKRLSLLTQAHCWMVKCTNADPIEMRNPYCEIEGASTTSFFFRKINKDEPVWLRNGWLGRLRVSG